MFPEILTGPQQNVLELLSRVPEMGTFYLAGGTALALHLGHRRSRDFDFFRAEDFLPQQLLSTLREQKGIEVLQETSGTLTVKLRGVPTSFFRYDYPLLRPLRETPWGLHLAHPDDIAPMKLSALAGRGSRKDFVDLYAYAHQVAPLDQVFEQFQDKYRGVAIDPYHLLRSLAYFADAEAEPMLEMLGEVSWETITTFFRAEAARLLRQIP